MKRIEDLTENEVIHCPTEQEAIALCKMMHEKGMKWRDGESYEKNTKWEYQKQETCYRPADGTRRDKGYFESISTTIHPASLFLPPHVYQGVPVYFAVKRDDSKEWGEYIEWLKRAFGSEWGGDTYKYYGYDGNSSFGGTWASSSSKSFENNPIVFESPKEFMDLLNKNTMKTDNRFPLSLSFEHATDIINIACSTWREKLAKLWATDIVLMRNIEISEDFYKEMRKACTAEQHKLFDDIFGKDVEDKNAFVQKFRRPFLNKISEQLFGGPDVFQIGEAAADNIDRLDLRGKSFYVHSNYEAILHKLESGASLIEIKKK
jgi:hypothetical protein